VLPKPFRVSKRYRLVINVYESAHPFTTKRKGNLMAVIKRSKKVADVQVKTKEVDRLDVAVAQGRQVRNFLTNLLNDLEGANAIHHEVKATEADKIDEAQRRIDIANSELEANAKLAEGLKTLGL
jgi:hypothetical protein